MCFARELYCGVGTRVFVIKLNVLMNVTRLMCYMQLGWGVVRVSIKQACFVFHEALAK